LIVRPETPADCDPIDRVVEAAFGRPQEARLVRALRDSKHYVAELALVAEEAGEVVGHIMFSYVTLRNDDEERRALCLAPVSVTPDRQRDGIGSALIEAGLKRADDRGEPLVVLLGHPAYYPRFGFRPASELGISPPSPEIPRPAFMACPLSRYDERYRGTISYPPEFEATGTI
jgi:putative acetyltransferase